VTRAISDPFDVVVVGVGGMGSAALFHVARRSARVLGLDQFDVPNSRGSSHGHTRIIRLAYWEHPAYVPLLRRAYELWHELQGLVGDTLLVTTGSIDAGAPDGRPIRGVLEACRQFALRHDVLDGASLHRRFPGYRLPANLAAVFQPDGGFLFPERCITAHLKAAVESGAELHPNERVVGWEDHDGQVLVRTDCSTYKARRVILTSGAWLGKVLHAVQPLVSVERQVVMWVAPRRPEHFSSERFPVFYLHAEEGSFYGVPVVAGMGLKIGKYHHLGQTVDPDSVDRACHPEDEAVLREGVRRYFPDADGATLDLQTCLFTNTADEHFIIDAVPNSPSVLLAGGFSGHGFKFCSVMGEILADMALNGSTRHDVSLFSLRRWE